VSCPGHPEGHGAVERAHRSINNVLRAHLLHRSDWPALVPAVEFSLNTAPSRILGTSPFRVCHGFHPRLPLHHALDVRPHNPSLSSPEPLKFSRDLVATASRIFQTVRRQQDAAYKAEVAAFRRSAPPARRFAVGDYALVHRDRPNKLDVVWTGPFRITAVLGDYVFELENLLTTERRRAHSNSLAFFHAGTLLEREVRYAACRPDELLVEQVLQHRPARGRNHYDFLCVCTGEPAPLWLPYQDCRFAPMVKHYIAQHQLHVRLH